MPKPLLLKRRSGLYVRFLVPGDLQGQIGSRFILRSLQGARADGARLMASALGYALGNVFERLRREDVPNARALVDQALQGIQRGRDFTVELPNGTKLLPQSIEADHRQAQDVILALARAGALSPPPTTIPVPTTPKVGLLSERIEKFLAQMKAQERSETNHDDTAFTLKVFLGLVDDKDLSEVGPDDLDIFMDGLAHWPANASKKKPYKGLSPKEVLKKAKQRQDKGLAPRTKEKHLDRLRLFFNNCVERRLISYNPCKGLRITNKMQDEQEGRLPFDEQDLRTIFSAENFSHSHDKPSKYWGPVLGLYTGARVNELGQLRVDDLEQVDGVWGIHIRHQVKNKSSKRFLPLHPELLKLGFVDYVDEVKSHGFEHVFPGLPWGVHGPGDPIADWFNRLHLRATCKITDATKTFHSFRHTFASLAERSGLSDSRIARLTGHSVGTSVLRRHYIQPSTLQERSEDMGKIKFPNLNIERPTKGCFDHYFMRVKAVEARARRNKK